MIAAAAASASDAPTTVLSLYISDTEWSLLWVLQLAVQLVLPDEHRAYTRHDGVETLMALYAAQVVLGCLMIAAKVKVAANTNAI